MKKYFITLTLFFAIGFNFAQLKPGDQLPMDPKVRTGILPNGMRYFIMKNAKPENRAELRLAVNAGSTMEEDDQQGLAHFVEHMAFNGSKNFKKNELVNYLESIGTKFGADLNAYTSFDETVYMLQLPTDNKDIYKKGFLVLEDWAHNLIFDSVEVDKERGVVMEEWRLGQGAFERMNRKTWPVLFKDSRYANRIPIGKPEILQGCKQERLRTFYKDWYRPDNQAIIVVGDIDLDATEKLVKEQFSKIPASKNPKPVKKWEVPDQKDMRVVVVSDKESPYNVLQLMYGHPRPELRTYNDYREDLKRDMFNSMISARLMELSKKANAPFLFAGAGFNSFLRNKGSYGAFAMFPNGKAEAALAAVVIENERVKRHGFVGSELERARKKLMSEFEQSFNEKDKTESKQITGELVQHFLTGSSVPGIENEYKYAKELIGNISLEEINALAKTWILPNGQNAVVVLMMAEKEGNAIPTEETVRKVFSGSEGLSDIKPYEDKALNEPLVAKRPRGQKVIKTEDRGFGVSLWTLGNGAKILIKPTNFKDDEILFNAFSWGGTNQYSDKDHLSASYCNAIQDEMGYGKFDKISLSKYMQDKNVNLGSGVGDISESMFGNSSKKDFETLLQLVYANFTMPRKDTSGYKAFLQMQRGFIQNSAADPNSMFRDSLEYYMSGKNVRSKPVSEEMLKEIELDRSYAIFKERFSDPSDFVFVFVGSFHPDSIKPLLEAYIGGISAPMKHEEPKDLGNKGLNGEFKKEFIKGNNPRSSVQLVWTGDFEYNRKNRFEMRALTQLLSIKLRENLREDKGGVYGVGIFPAMEHFPKGAYKFIEVFSCAPQNVETLISASISEINDVKKNGCSEVNLKKIKETLLKERETDAKENNFWLSYVSSAEMYKEPLADLDKYSEWVNGLKSEDFKRLANTYFNEKQFKRFVLNPEK